MKVAFIIEYFPPFAPGGGEWSTFYLARDLVKKGVQVTVITPNLGAKSKETIDGVKIRRFPFYLNLKDKTKFPGHFAFTNPLWLLWSTFFYFYYLKKTDPEIIHVQGKYSIPPVMISNLFLKKPIVATIRDYIVICNYGMCLSKGNKACGLKKYFIDDFRNYYQIYVKNKSFFNLFINLVYAIWGKMSSTLIRKFAQNLKVIVLSEKQKDVFKANGFKNLTVIGNSFSFSENLPYTKKENAVLFAGRLTPGKGVELIMKIIGRFFKNFQSYRFYFAGEGFLRQDLIRLQKKYRQIVLLGLVEHKELLRIISKVKLVIMPSIWPEPFGRVALEAISQKTPVVVTNSGGLPEIVENNKYGVVVKPTSEELFKGIKAVLKNNTFYKKKISKDYRKIIKRFGEDILEKNLELYNRLIQ